MDGQIDRLAEILKLSDGLNGAELRELSERIEQDPATKQKLFWQDLETSFQEAKTLWATLTVNGDRRAFKEHLQKACSHAKALWVALDKLETFEVHQARAELRDRLQAAYDMDLTFERATIDGETFHIDGGQVVDGPAADNDAEVPF